MRWRSASNNLARKIFMALSLFWRTWTQETHRQAGEIGAGSSRHTGLAGHPNLVLGALVLHRHHHAAGHVGDAHGALGLVDVLPASARRAVHFDAQIVLPDLDLYLCNRAGSM